MQAGQDPKFPTHVMGGLDAGSERGAAEHQLARSQSEQVGQVRITARELSNLERTPLARPVRAEKGGQFHQVEFLPRAG